MNHITTRRLVFGFVLAGLLCGGVDAAEVRLFYALQVDNAGHEYQVLLNGSSVAGEHQADRRYVEAYLRDGENRLEIRFRKAPDAQPPAEPKFDVHLLKERFPNGAGQPPETAEIYAFHPDPAALLPETWQTETAVVMLKLRGDGPSYFELETQSQGTHLEVSINNWSKPITVDTFMGRIPFATLHNGDNTLRIAATSLAPERPVHGWEATLYQRWDGGGFEPLAHLESDQPAVGEAQQAVIGLKGLPVPKSLTSEPVGQITPAERQAILEQVQALYTAYQAEDANAVLALEGPALKNIWAQYGVSEKRHDELTQSATAQLQEAFGNSWTLAPMPADLTVVPEQGLAKVSAASPIIQGSYKPGGLRGALNRSTLYYARHDGRWSLVNFKF